MCSLRLSLWRRYARDRDLARWRGEARVDGARRHCAPGSRATQLPLTLAQVHALKRRSCKAFLDHALTLDSTALDDSRCHHPPSRAQPLTAEVQHSGLLQDPERRHTATELCTWRGGCRGSTGPRQPLQWVLDGAQHDLASSECCSPTGSYQPVTGTLPQQRGS